MLDILGGECIAWNVCLKPTYLSVANLIWNNNKQSQMWEYALYVQSVTKIATKQQISIYEYNIKVHYMHKWSVVSMCTNVYCRYMQEWEHI